MEKNELHIPRGTTQTLSVKIYWDDGSVYEPQDGDVVRFGVKLARNLSGYAISKTAVYDGDNEEYVISLAPEDTASLGFDRYTYDIGLQTSDGDYYMIIEAAWFYVDTAITGKVSES